MELAGRTAIVTGAGRGIGRALALQFGRCGARVACCARRKHEIEETVRLIEAENGSGLAIPTDVTDRTQVQHMVTTVLSEFGSVDVLFNNAGSFVALGGIWEVDPDRWWQDVTVNLLGVMLCCQAVLPHMMAQNEGLIINMMGGDHIPGGTGYSCSKVGVTRLTELMAREQEMEGTSVLVVGMGPGFVHTEMTDYQITSPEGQKWLPSSQQAIESGQALPPERCAETTVELIQAACPAINGRVFGAGMDIQKTIADLQRE
jgi:3-oxoacyl-[acyl-carrier protein] reductase